MWWTISNGPYWFVTERHENDVAVFSCVRSEKLSSKITSHAIVYWLWAVFAMSAVDPYKISKVVVHPLVLLSVVDHFNRMGKIGNMKRVVGILLGSNRQGVLDVSNSFAGLLFILHIICIDMCTAFNMKNKSETKCCLLYNILDYYR